MLSIKQALSEHAAASNRDFGGDRRHTVGASEIGQCERKTWFSKFEGDADARGAVVTRDEDYEDGWGARARGSVYEAAWWAPALKARFDGQGGRGSLLYAGDDQRTLVLDYLSATPDGLVTGQGADALAHLGVGTIDPAGEGADCVAVECKTADPRTKLDKPKPEHVFQVVTQVGLIRAATNHRPAYGVLSYTDASFWDEVIEFPIRFDESVFATARERARRIMTAGTAEALKPEGYIAGGRECDRCAFARPCGMVDQARLAKLSDKGEVPAEIAHRIEAKAIAARLSKNEAEAATKAARAKEDEIKTLLGEAGVRSYRSGAVSVTWSPVKGRPSWDNKGIREAAEAAGIDLSPFSTVGSPTDRLTISSSK